MIEVLVAIGLAAIILPAILTGLITSRQGKAQEGQRIGGVALLREAEEAVRVTREKSWSSIPANGMYHPMIVAGTWSLAANSETIGVYTRQVVISDVQRDASGAIVNSGTVDPSTKKIVSSVSWGSPIASAVSSTDYIGRYLGNTAWQQTTQADFNTGSTKVNTVTTNTSGGEVILASGSSNADLGNKFLVTANSSIGLMSNSTDATSLRFTAQNSKKVNAIRVYLHSENGSSPSYRYGIEADSSGFPSGTYLGSGVLKAVSAGWQTITLSPAVTLTAGSVYHIVVQYSSGGINASKSIALRQTSPQNSLYPLTNVADSAANTLFNSGSGWVVQNFQPMYELDYSDGTFEGNPYESNTEVAINTTNFIGEKFQITGSNKTVTDISFNVRRNSATSPADTLQVVLQDADLNTIIDQGVLATAASMNTSYSYKTYTFGLAHTLTVGKNYRIYLKSPGSNTTNYYIVSSIVTTNAANFNSITFDGTNSFYSLSGNSGTSWTDTNTNSDIGGYHLTYQISGGFATAGTFESASFDTAGSSAFNYLTWTGNVPPNTSLRFQVAINNDNSTWNYFGSDGNLGTYFASPASIPLNRVAGRYIRYKATFTSDGSATPTLYDVTINYSP